MRACYPSLEEGEGVGSGVFYGVESASKGSMHRTPSVDDLFAPLWRLEVQQQENLAGGMLRSKIEAAMPMISARSSRNPEPKCSDICPIDVPPSTSASEEDQLGLVDDKKQKRMLSNRESARRSRLRKQQHLEELRSQLLELRAQNSHILGKLSIASEQFTHLSHDNQLLRMHAVDLTRQLQQLHHQATALHPDGLQAFGFGSSHLDPPGVAVGSSTSAYSIVSDVLQGGIGLCS